MFNAVGEIMMCLHLHIFFSSSLSLAVSSEDAVFETSANLVLWSLIC